MFPPAIEIKNATVKLDGYEALTDFSCTIGHRERWFVLGPNGAGKTTFVKLLLGLAWPLWGASVKVLGQKYGECNIIELRKKVAWVSPFLNSWAADSTYSQRWKALDIVLGGLDSTIGFFRKPSADDLEQAEKAMEMIHATKLADRWFDRLSSGEQVRILIARALISHPELVILDEACIFLDLTSREILLNAVDDLAARPDSPTMVFVTQRIEEITASFDKGMIIKDGKIMASGDRKDVLTEKNLSEAFELNVMLDSTADGRLWPIVKK